ncbi:MAG: hypothetical protein KKD39_08630 [Candidatus Altiarchaeota archaeon]|nr:hypothetical protein [Candidatus Altiarchaeota archaeon]
MSRKRVEKSRIVIPGQEDLDSRLHELKPKKRDKVVLYGPDGKVVSSNYGSGWTSEEDIRRYRVPREFERVVAVEDFSNARAKAREIQEKLFRKELIGKLKIFSIFEDTLRIPIYLEEHRLGFPTEHVRFCERHGFDHHLYPIAKDLVREGDEHSYLTSMRGLMEECGFKDVKSAGMLVSLAYPNSKKHDLISRSHRFFFAYALPPLMDAFKSGADSDGMMQNLKLIFDSIDVKARPAVFMLLGKNPKAAKQLVGINWYDVEGVSDFFSRLLSNPGSFDGIKKS